MNTLRGRIYFHIDGDAFFASCEQATKLALCGKPIAVGRERGIVTALSYEAKRMGVRRTMSSTQIQAEFPVVQLITSDYRKYGLYSKRLIHIVQSYTPHILYASIDECFSDMTDIASSYNDALILASKLQQEVRTKLGLTVSIGIGPTLTLAKLGSGRNKPNGITLIHPDHIKDTLQNIRVSSVSGIGEQTTKLLAKFDIHTIGDLLSKNKSYIDTHFSKPLKELHAEICGIPVRTISTSHEPQKSISRIRAFQNPINTKEGLILQLSRNTEMLMAEIRRTNRFIQNITIGVKKFPDMHTLHTKNVYIPQATQSAREIMKYALPALDELFDHNVTYHAIYVGTSRIEEAQAQQSLFENNTESNTRNKAVDSVIDSLKNSFGGKPLSIGLSIRKKITSPTETHDQNEGTPLLLNTSGTRPLSILYLGEIS